MLMLTRIMAGVELRFASLGLRVDLSSFLADMGERPVGKSLDRIDYNGDYSPDNCKWSTREEQAENRRSSILVTFNGETKCISAWARELSVERYAIHSLIKKEKTLDELFNSKP
jgi:hypothetical protein